MTAASSPYRGVRATLTVSPDGGTMVLALAVKRADARWDEWSLLFPAVIERPPDGVHSLADALALLQEHLGQARQVV